MKHVAVVTPIFNPQDDLHRAIRSVLAQEGVDLELFLIDDGSTGNSAAIAQHYQQRDPRVVFVRKADAGQGSARNMGLTLASAEYVHFVDSDDHLGPGALATLYRTAREHALDICSPGVPSHDLDKPLEWVSCLPCKSQFIRRALLQTHGVRQTDARSGQDGVFSHLALAHCTRIGMTPEAVCHYTHAREGSSFAVHLNFYAKLAPDVGVERREVSPEELTETLHQLKRRTYPGHLIVLGHLYDQSHRTKSRRHLHEPSAAPARAPAWPISTPAPSWSASVSRWSVPRSTCTTCLHRASPRSLPRSFARPLRSSTRSPPARRQPPSPP
jgi:glycosyltransferase involved in cell wall biosynthesis